MRKKFFDVLHARIHREAIGEAWSHTSLAPVIRTIPAREASFYEGTYKLREDVQGSVSRTPEGGLIYEDPEAAYRVALVPLVGIRWLHSMFDAICEFRGLKRAEMMACHSPVLERQKDTAYEMKRVG